MGVQVREKPKGSGIYYVFINYQGKRKSKKIGTNKKTAIEIADKIKAKLVIGEIDINKKSKNTFPDMKNGIHFSTVKPPNNPIGNFVYFVQQDKVGPVKIGITKNNIIKRIESLQTASPLLLRLVSYIRDPYPETIENDLHYQFRKHRLKGEWFKPDMEILNFIKGRIITDKLEK